MNVAAILFYVFISLGINPASLGSTTFGLFDLQIPCGINEIVLSQSAAFLSRTSSVFYTAKTLLLKMAGREGNAPSSLVSETKVMLLYELPMAPADGNAPSSRGSKPLVMLLY